MCQLPPQSIRTYTLFPSPTLFRSLAPILRQNLVIGEPLDFAQDGIGAERLGQFRRRAKAFRQRVAIIAGDKEARHGPVLEQFGAGVTKYTIYIDVTKADVYWGTVRRSPREGQRTRRNKKTPP